MRIVMLLLCLFATALPAQAEDPVYRYKDANGVIHYTDKPPSKEAKPVTLPHLQTYKSQPPPKAKPATAAKSGPAPTPPAPVGFSVSIESPTPDQTLRDNSGEIGVSVSVMPGLVGGYGLVYALDGKAQGGAVQETTYSIKGVTRGTHSVSVSLVGPDNKPVASNSVDVHVMPPMVK